MDSQHRSALVKQVTTQLQDHLNVVKGLSSFAEAEVQALLVFAKALRDDTESVPVVYSRPHPAGDATLVLNNFDGLLGHALMAAVRQSETGWRGIATSAKKISDLLLVEDSSADLKIHRLLQDIHDQLAMIYVKYVSIYNQADEIYSAEYDNPKNIRASLEMRKQFAHRMSDWNTRFSAVEETKVSPHRGDVANMQAQMDRYSHGLDQNIRDGDSRRTSNLQAIDKIFHVFDPLILTIEAMIQYGLPSADATIHKDPMFRIIQAKAFFAILGLAANNYQSIARSTLRKGTDSFNDMVLGTLYALSIPKKAEVNALYANVSAWGDDALAKVGAFEKEINSKTGPLHKYVDMMVPMS